MKVVKEYNFNLTLNNQSSYRRLMFGNRMFSGRITFVDKPYGKIEIAVGSDTIGHTQLYENIEDIFADWNIVDRRVLIEKIGHSL